LKRGLYLGTKKKQKGVYIKGRREYILWIISISQIFSSLCLHYTLYNQCYNKKSYIIYLINLKKNSF